MAILGKGERNVEILKQGQYVPVKVEEQAEAKPETAESEAKALLDRAEAEVVSLRKWDERRLAYAIKGQKRGLYIIGGKSGKPSGLFLGMHGGGAGSGPRATTGSAATT